MRHVAIAIVIAAGIPACSIPDKQLVPIDAPPDAPPGPFACYNKGLPTIAADPVVITGQVLDRYNGISVASATVEAFQVGQSTSVFSVSTDAMGRFTRTQGTGTAPRDFYFRITANGYLPTYFYPAVPIVANHDIQVFVFDTTSVGKLAQAAQVTVDPTKAMVTVSVTDCNGQPLGGATVMTSPAGDVRYFDSTETPSPSATATDTRTGTALVANVSPSTVTIDATVSGMRLRTHSVTAMAGAILETEIQP